MKAQINTIGELLKFRTGLGPSKRHLIRYEGELAINNRIGLAADRK
ncbi:MAG: hypothetical protein PVJ86_01000 [Phycisphaerales bacterium]|jgi:hypothetical protein